MSVMPLLLLFGDNLPPYILVGSSSGIEVDIVREALAYRGHVLEPVFMPMGRIPVAFLARKTDAIMMDVGQDMAPSGGVYGAAPVLYDNYMYTLARRRLQWEIAQTSEEPAKRGKQDEARWLRAVSD